MDAVSKLNTSAIAMASTCTVDVSVLCAVGARIDYDFIYELSWRDYRTEVQAEVPLRPDSAAILESSELILGTRTSQLRNTQTIYCDGCGRSQCE